MNRDDAPKSHTSDNNTNEIEPTAIRNTNHGVDAPQETSVGVPAISSQRGNQLQGLDPLSSSRLRYNNSPYHGSEAQSGSRLRVVNKDRSSKDKAEEFIPSDTESIRIRRSKSDDVMQSDIENIRLRIAKGGEVMPSDIDSALLMEEMVQSMPALPTDAEESTPHETLQSADMISIQRLPFMVLYHEYGFCKATFLKLHYFLTENWSILLFVLLASLALMFLGIFSFDPISWKAWMAFAIVIITLALLIKGSFPTQVSMLIGVTAMLAFFIITPSQALVGFSNVGVATVVVLFTISEGIKRTSALQPILRFILGKPKSLFVAQLRLLIPASILSGFLNDTPVVVMLIPVVLAWTRRCDLPASKLLMPMNDAVLLGGTCTLIGTSTNLVVVGLAQAAKVTDQDGNLLNFNIFGITLIGIPYLATGLLYMFIFTNLILKDRTQALDQIIRNPREYTVALKVEPTSPIINETVAGAGLRNLQGLFLVELTRENGELLAAPSPETKIESGDILLFAGVVETVTELYHIPGLIPANTQTDKIKLQRHRRRLVELVISPSSVMVGMSVRESRFRKRFSAAIIAVHRHGEHVREKVGDIILRAGDVLLIETDDVFIQRFGKDSNFSLVVEVAGSQPPRSDKLHMVIAGLTVIAMIAVSAAEVMNLMVSALLAMFILIATQCMTLRNAADAISIPVVLTIALSFGLSQGLEKTGAAEQLANFFVSVFKGLGNIGLLFGIYLGTALLSAVITNNAAAALMFPIVADPKTGIIVQQGLNPYAALYVMMLAASAAFCTPIAYQTNLMVHGPGGYRFVDWVIYGFPLQCCCMVVGVLVANWVYPS